MKPSPLTLVVGQQASQQPAPRRAQALQHDPAPATPSEDGPQFAGHGRTVERPLGMYVTTGGRTYFCDSEAAVLGLPGLVG